jgi:hypothetical protein
MKYVDQATEQANTYQVKNWCTFILVENILGVTYIRMQIHLLLRDVPPG